MSEETEDRLAKIEAMLSKVLERLEGPASSGRVNYSVEEAATILGKAPYTVREWCRLGRINAVKRGEARGRAVLWGVPADELGRLKDQGLLPVDVSRNA